MSARILRIALALAAPSLSASAATVGETGLTYDLYGGVQEVRTPSGGIVDYAFNLDGATGAVRYTSPAGAVEPVLAATAWDAAGNPLHRTFGTSGDASYRWDALGRQAETTLDLGGSLPAYHAGDLRYNEWGNLASYERYDRLFIAPLELAYRYTSQGQLETFHLGPSRRADYSYDMAGNLTERTGFALGSLTLPALSPTHYNSLNQRADWLYDGAGRLVEDDRYRYHYNGAGRLVLLREAESGEIVAHYVYDTNGYRVRTLEDDRVTYHFRDGAGTLISEEVRDAAGELIETRDYVTTGGQALLTATHRGDGTEELEYRFTDRLGNPVVRWDGQSEPSYQEYSPYGHPMRLAAFEPGAHGFTGHEDDSTGRTYMRARYYDASFGRFLQPDPARAFSAGLPSTHNLYQYSFGNPVNLVDPSGGSPGAVAAGVAAGAAIIWKLYNVYSVGKDVEEVVLASQAIHHAHLIDQDMGTQRAAELARGSGAALGAGFLINRIPGLGALIKRARGSATKLNNKLKNLLSRKCFVAGTLVLTPGGPVPIESLEIGDSVLSRNERSGELTTQEVTELFVTEDQPVWNLLISNPAGEEETFRATAEHPFWVEDLGWVPVARLQLGDRLLGAVGGWLEVRQVRGSPRRETVYNFEVAADHTYFVGKLGVWVHNKKSGEKQPEAPTPVEAPAPEPSTQGRPDDGSLSIDDEGPTRQIGDRFKRGDDPLQQLEEIEQAQGRYRRGKSNKPIDSIKKSEQRAKHSLKRRYRSSKDIDPDDQ